MKAKKLKQMQRRHWRLEYKNFLMSMGEVGLVEPFLKFFKREPAKIKLKTRLSLMWAIFKAPGLNRRKKLVPYIDKRWQGKGLGNQEWVNYNKVIGLVRFKCRTKRNKPGEMVQILVNETWWDEGKALDLLNKDMLKMYNEAEVKS